MIGDSKDSYSSWRTMQRNWKKVAKSPKIEISRIGPCPISLESYDHWLLTSGIYFAFKNIFNPFFGGWKWSIFMIFQKVPNLQGKYRVSQYKKINFSTISGQKRTKIGMNTNKVYICPHLKGFCPACPCNVIFWIFKIGLRKLKMS